MSIIIPYKKTLPKIHESAFIAQNAVVAGDVHIGADSNLWFGVSMRGDVHEIRIGKRTNIQDGSVIHVTSGVSGTYIGDEVTVGHMALLHACTVGDRALVGMKACVLDEAIIEPDSMVAAGALVTPKKVVRSGELWGGSPARYMRDLTKDELKFLRTSADNYVRLSKTYQAI